MHTSSEKNICNTGERKVDRRNRLALEVKQVWSMKMFAVLTMIVGDQGICSRNFEKHIEQIRTAINVRYLQKTPLLGTARTLGMALKK